jgi:methionyl-tRNA synthetase
MKRSYITTAIDFPNGAPHMGHVMEKVMADVYARWCRLRGDEVRFQIGTDDHGSKLQRTAEAVGMHPRDLVLSNIPKFVTLFDQLHISYDAFVSTSVANGHYETAQGLWNALLDAGYLYQKEYTGLYCSGCEEFKNERDLVDGLCVNHQKAPEPVAEKNWFFKLTACKQYVENLLSTKAYSIVPEFRSAEVRSFLENGFADVSFSRPKTSLYWGVPVPNDPDQVMYVWCDNLTSYISSLGYFTPNVDTTFWNDAEVTHIVGKDITRFHGINWPAMLHCAGVKIPNRLLVHGFLTSNGQKMSKSIGNVVEPHDVLEHVFGNPDPLRFYLSHEIPVGNDGDFSWERFDALYNSKLRKQLGNLLNRVLVLLGRTGGRIIVTEQPELLQLDWQRYSAAMNEHRFHDALLYTMQLVDAGNKYMEDTKPWEQSPETQIMYLSQMAEFLRHIALQLLPFIPATAQRMSVQLGVPYAEQMLLKNFVLSDQLQAWCECNWENIGQPELLFAPLEL